MFLYHISPENVYIFSRAEVMNYLITYSVFKSFRFLAQKLSSIPLLPHKQIYTTSENLYFHR